MKLETSNNTKIVATMGPASWHKDVMKDMIVAGVNVFRVNFSHGDHETHRRTIRLVKELNKEFNCKTAVLADLQGPKLRIGDVVEGAVIIPSGTFIATQMALPEPPVPINSSTQASFGSAIEKDSPSLP